MSHSVIKNNITRLLEEKNWKISQLEQKIGSNRAVSNILRGSSKNPTIQMLQSIANAFEVNIDEIINEQIINGPANIILLKDCCNQVINELEAINTDTPPSYNEIITKIKEVYEYTVHLNLKEVDNNFVKWTIHKKN